MNNQWKMVPVEPTPEMYAAAKGSGVFDPRVSGRCYDLMLAAAPVPPAGDVEVLGYSVKGNRYAIRLTKAELLELYEGYTGSALIELVDRAHVTRLTAERDQAEHMRKFWAESAAALSSQVDTLQSELTKARELLEDSMQIIARAQNLVPDVNYSWVADAGVFINTNQREPAIDESCGQDAEAAKGGSDE